MGTGLSILLIAAGAILAFAVQDAVEGVALGTVGWILMAAGLIGLIIGLVMNNQRTHTRHTVVEDRRNIEDRHIH